MSLEEQYARATERVQRKKAAFLSSAAVAKARVTPSRLKQDIKHKTVEGVSNGSAHIAAKIHERPIAAGAAAGALLLYLLRRPLWALFKRTYVRITDHSPETSETDDG